MPRYYHGTSYHHQARYIRRVRRLVIGIALIAALAGFVVFVDALRETEHAETPSETTEGVHGSFQPASQIFHTPYFQFQADPSWKEVQNESTSKKFVYRSFRGSLVRHEMTISVNDPPANAATTRVLPVEVGADNELTAGKTSDHCRTALPPNSKDVASITLNEVRFLCNPEATDYSVNVGLKGRAAPINIKRPDGSMASYSIVYRDVTASPGDHELREILSAFQIR
jgi:hypothetical protein